MKFLPKIKVQKFARGWLSISSLRIWTEFCSRLLWMCSLLTCTLVIRTECSHFCGEQSILVFITAEHSFTPIKRKLERNKQARLFLRSWQRADCFPWKECWIEEKSALLPKHFPDAPSPPIMLWMFQLEQITVLRRQFECCTMPAVKTLIFMCSCLKSAGNKYTHKGSLV